MTDDTLKALAQKTLGREWPTPLDQLAMAGGLLNVIEQNRALKADVEALRGQVQTVIRDATVVCDLLHAVEQERDAAEARTPPDDWFNQICAALGLFDGARPVSTQSVTWKEVLPMIAALKANNPEAAVMVAELQRVRELWADALRRLYAKSSALGPPVPACPHCQSL